MTQQITVQIDGALIRAPKGSSVLDAALDFGICIPHLCRVPYIEDIGACRLCIVEHIVNGRSRIRACKHSFRAWPESLRATVRHYVTNCDT